jgi:tRNA 2-thiouridine synthesizing protein B
MTLHVVNKPPTNPAITSCLAAALAGDVVLLIEHGVYCGSVGAPDKVTMCVLDLDVLARGLNGKIPPNVQVIDDARFVELACEHNPIVTWA